MNKEINTTVSVAENTEKVSKTNIVMRALKCIRRPFIALNTFILSFMLNAVTAFADGAGGGGGLDTNAGVDEFNKIIEFFATWIGRIGLVVGFVGAIMFALAIKNEDAEAKSRGLMTLAAGFVVFAITEALDLFGVGGVSGAGA